VAVHFKEKLADFVAKELEHSERQAVAEHLLVCDECRREHDELKFASDALGVLKGSDAPRRTWHLIEQDLGSKPRRSYFVPALIGSFAAIALVSVAALFIHNAQKTETANTSAWNFTVIAGSPDAPKGSNISAGERIETDDTSRALIKVGDIGSVEVKPNSKIEVIATKDHEQRLSLEKGSLHAKILAPPRLFIVDTPSAMAVDLGCEYTLSVNENGDNQLVVLTGFVALERDGRESIVPSGASCLTVNGKGIGTPFATGADAKIRESLRKFDFENGGDAELQKILDHSTSYDTITLWHLISRVDQLKRGDVIDRLQQFVPMPNDVTRDAVQALDKSSLDKWRGEVERIWFGK